MNLRLIVTIAGAIIQNNAGPPSVLPNVVRRAFVKALEE